MRQAKKFQWKNMKGIDHVAHLCINDRIIDNIKMRPKRIGFQGAIWS
jgi:hypothetical protein